MDDSKDISTQLLNLKFSFPVATNICFFDTDQKFHEVKSDENTGFFLEKKKA